MRSAAHAFFIVWALTVNITAIPAVAGPILAASDPEELTLDFICCNGAAFPVDDLEITYRDNLISITTNAPPGCDGSPVANMAVINCNMVIPVGAEFEIGASGRNIVLKAGDFVSACWTGEACVAPAIPTPEPSSLVMVVGATAFFILGFLRSSSHRTRRN
jgi:hypothetical protein